MEQSGINQNRLETVKRIVRGIVDHPKDLSFEVLTIGGHIKEIEITPWVDSDYARIIGKQGKTYFAIAAAVSFLFEGHTVTVKINEARKRNSEIPDPLTWELEAWEELFFAFLELWLGRPSDKTVTASRGSVPIYRVRTGRKLTEEDLCHVSRIFQSIAKHHGGLVRVLLSR